MFPYARIVVCAVCSASAQPPQAPLLGLCWLRRAIPPRSSAGCAEPDGALVATWHVRAAQSAAWPWADPKHDALLSPVISYLCDRQRFRPLLDTTMPSFSRLPVGARSRVWTLVGAAPYQIVIPTPLRLRHYPRKLSTTEHKTDMT